MSQPALTGSVVQPDYVSQPHSFAAHDFFNTLRKLVHMSTLHNEADVAAALATIDGYEKHVVGAADLARVISENDRAPVEDVSQRKAASGELPTAVSGSIDYARLAAAIVAAQQAQSQQATAPQPEPEVHQITDVPAPAAPAPTYGGDTPYPQVTAQP
jgi:hypothetical protein